MALTDSPADARTALCTGLSTLGSGCRCWPSNI